MRRRPALAALALAAIGAGVLAGPASAAFPGLNGRIVFERNSQIHIKDPGVAAVATAITSSGENIDPTWSPDGLRIAFARDPAGIGFQIWTMDAAGGNLVQRTFDAGDKSSPAWSPDGTRLAYAVNNGTDDDVAVASLTPAPALTIASGAGDQRNPVWTPDGSRVLFQDTGDTLSIVGATGTGRAPFLSDAIQPDFSPDGTRIVVTRVGQLPFIVNADGTGTTNIPAAQPAARPVWSPDGTLLLFQRTGGPSLNGLWRFPLGGASATRETPGPTLDFGADWQPIGAVPAITGLAVGPTLVVTGSGFAYRSVVRWNGADRPTTWISPTRLHAQLSAADLTPGAAQVTVFTSPSGGGLSAPATAVIAGPPPPPPRVVLTGARLAKVSWSASRISGRLVLNGSLERAGRVEIALLSGSRVAQRRVLDLPAAPFALQIPLAAGLVPGRYTVRVREPAPPAGSPALVAATGTVTVASPPEGVARTSFVSALQNGPPARTLRGKSRIYATFRLATLPKKASTRLTTRWFGPGGVRTDATGKPRRRVVTSFVSSRSALPSGIWRCELRAGRKLVAVARVRLR